MVRKSFAADIALYAIFTALIATFMWFNFVFLLPLIVAVYLMDFKASVFLSLMTGLISLAIAFSLGASTIVSYAFINYPWLPVVPRLFVGPAAYGVKKLLQKAFWGSKNILLKEILPAGLCGATAALTNTVLVLSSFALFIPDLSHQGMPILTVIPLIITGFAIPEFFICLLVTPLLVIPLKKAAKNLRVLKNYE